MAKRRGLLRRLLDQVLGRREEEPPKPPAQQAQTPKPQISKTNLRTRALNNMLSKLAFLDRNRVMNRLTFMTDDELQWTAIADQIELQVAASQQPDRIDDDKLPLNPWWYH
jgi:hypothetical protein